MNQTLMLELLKQVHEQTGDWRAALDEAIEMVEDAIAREQRQKSPTYFGTSEEHQVVEVRRLEPGVRVSGRKFDRTNTLVVQEVRGDGGGPERFNVTVAEQETGDVISKWWYGHAPMECWGRL